MEEKILTRHPYGKKGVNVSKVKYDVMRGTITSALRKKALSHNELVGAVHTQLEGKFEGSINWYMESVKLDLEANNVVERTDDIPQRYRLIG